MAQASGKTIILILLSMVALAGCDKVRNLAGQFDPRELPEQVQYEQRIAPYLAYIPIYAGPATSMLAKALVMNEEVRAAQVEREAKALGLTDKDRAKLETDQEASAALGLEIVLSIFVPEREYNNLGKPDSSWRLFLLDEQGRQIKPIDVREIKKRTQLLQALYPFWGDWDFLFKVRFPLELEGRPFPSAETAALTMVITGPSGRNQVQLRLR